MANYEGYCVKCREKREFDGHEVELANGRRAAQGTCPGLRHQDEPDPGQSQGLSRHAGPACEQPAGVRRFSACTS
jgi:hypothetical protein